MKVDWQVKKYLAEKIEGGLAEGMHNSQFDPNSLHKGMLVELEHTNDPEVAEEIAKDHLVEDSEYYEKLAKMEGGMMGVENVFFASKDVKFFEPNIPEEAPFKGVSAFEAMTGLETPDAVRGPAFPHRARLLKPEQKKRMAQEQAEIAMQSDAAFHDLEADEPEKAQYAIEDVEAVQREQDEFTSKNEELRFFGGHPLTKARKAELKDELETARDHNLRRMGIRE